MSDKREYKGVMLSPGRILFNKCLPEDYPVVDEVVDKKKLNDIMTDIVFKYDVDTTMSVLDKIKKLGFMGSTLNGFTLSLDDLYNEKLYDFGDSLSGDLNEDMKLMSSPEIKELLNSLPIAEYINSGARGTWEQAKQLVLCRGYVSDVSGDIKKTPIKRSLLKGLDQRDFFNSSYGARKGLLDTAVSTGDSGFLTRKLIYSTATIELGEEEDCGTTDFMKFHIDNEKMAKSFLWRTMFTKKGYVQINSDNYKLIVGKDILLRSPIYCKNPKVCKTCYGNTWRLLHTNQIGIIATQGLGEVSVQLVLRSFHTAGVAKVKEGENKQHDIVSGMQGINSLLHYPSEVSGGQEGIVRGLYNIFNEYKAIQMVHHEVIASSLMWVGNTPWRISENRNSTPVEWVSILQAPSRQSWLLGFAFSHVKKKLLEAVIESENDKESELTKLFKF